MISDLSAPFPQRRMSVGSVILSPDLDVILPQSRRLLIFSAGDELMCVC